MENSARLSSRLVYLAQVDLTMLSYSFSCQQCSVRERKISAVHTAPMQYYNVMNVNSMFISIAFTILAGVATSCRV